MLDLNHSTLLATVFAILFSPTFIFWYTLDHNSRQIRLRRRPRYWIRVHGCTVSSTRAVRLYSHVNARQLSPITERVNEANSWSPVLLAPRLYLFHNPCMSNVHFKQTKGNDIYETYAHLPYKIRTYKYLVLNLNSADPLEDVFLKLRI